GAVFGPIVGGFMLSMFWWGSVFLLAVPVMAVLMIAGPALLPEYRNPAAGRLDLFSVALSLAAIIPFIYGIKELARNGWKAGPVVAVVAGLVFGALFVRRQRRLADPLLDPSLFRVGVLRSALVLSLVVGSIQGGSLLLINMYLQMVVGMSPLRTGLWLVPTSLAMVFTIMLSAGLARKFRPAYLMAIGMLTSAAGYFVLTGVPSSGGLTRTVVGACIAMAGVGP